jgi:uncharacterized protein (TIGR03437 family)
MLWPEVILAFFRCSLLLAVCHILCAQTVNYSYDAAGRLNGVTYPNGNVMTYAYDAAGNLLRRLVVAPAKGPAPTSSAAGVVNAASELGGSVAPGEIVAIYGTGVGPATLANFQISPFGFFESYTGNTGVTFDGIAAPLIYSSGGQTAAIVPYSVVGQTSTQMVVTYQGLSSAPVTLPVAASAPGLFSANASGKGNGAIGNFDGSVNSPANPAARGSVIVLYGSGEGQTNPAGVDGRIALSVYPKPVLPVKVSIGGIDASSGILYAGAAPTLVAGVFQINVTVPPVVPAGAVPVVVTIGQASSQSGLTVSLK